jgi:alkanesulfonate monooxygenase SsuD/methylene tetrahydromethanopterin reductase-like flavin-dependent oxidoreductase (luciferase family)
MEHELRFGIAALQNRTWEREAERWRYIEELGFDSLWVADHFVNYMSPQGPWMEAWTLLAGLAAVTKRIRIGTLVTAIPFRNPAVLARQALTVDHISGGRLELGLGAGAPGSIDPSYQMTGIEDWAPPERVARFREVVEILDKCLSNPVTTYNGRYYKLKDCTLAPPPKQHPRPPITIGAMGNTMLKIAAKYADTWNTYGGDWGIPVDQILEGTRKRNQQLDRYCERIGRDPTTLRRSLLYFTPFAEVLFESEEIFETFVQQYREAGISEFILFYPEWYTEDQLPKFEHIAREVIPKLRK